MVGQDGNRRPVRRTAIRRLSRSVRAAEDEATQYQRRGNDKAG